MHLYDEENHEKSMSEEQKSEKRPAFIEGNEDNNVEYLLLLAPQVYEPLGLPTWRSCKRIADY